MKKKTIKKQRPTVGWREWVALPGLSVPAVKAKIDTGARSSALHAFDVHTFNRDGITMVRFSVHPWQRNSQYTITSECPLLEWREVRSSVGHITRRPVIITELRLLEDTEEHWPIELTLVNRDEMGFRMLLGRQALRRRVTIDPGKSYLTGRPPAELRGIKKRKKKKPQTRKNSQ